MEYYNYLILLICILLIIFLFILWQYLEIKQKYNHLHKTHKDETSLKAKHQKEVSITKAMLQGELQERHRLAKELHDGIGAMMSSIKLKISTLNSRLQHEELAQSIDLLDNTINELRRVSHNMMPNNIIKYGLGKSLSDFFIELKHHTPHPIIKYETYGKWIDFSQDKELNIYRIITELTINAVKHASADIILVQLVCNESQMNITIEDNGKGFDAELQQGIGLENIKSRVNYLNGKIDFQSQPHKGTSIFVQF